MPLVAFFALSLVGIYFLGQRYGYKLVVDRVKSAYGDLDMVAYLEPLKVDGRYVGFNLRINNLVNRDMVVNWSESQYWFNGSTNGKLLFQGTPISIQLNKEPPNDTISGMGTMVRNLIPVATLREDRSGMSSLRYPIDGGTIEKDITPPPTYSILDTEEGNDGILRPVGGYGDPPRGTPAPKKQKRTLRIPSFAVVGQFLPSQSDRLYPGTLSEGSHGILLSLVRNNEPYKIALSFDLKREKRTK